MNAARSGDALEERLSLRHGSLWADQASCGKVATASDTEKRNTMLIYTSPREVVLQLPACLQPASRLLSSHPTLRSLSSSLSHPGTHRTYILPPINASRLPSTHPFSIVCTSILLSLPWCPALHREEAALPLPSSLVRTIHACSLTSLSVSLALKL